MTAGKSQPPLSPPSIPGSMACIKDSQITWPRESALPLSSSGRTWRITTVTVAMATRIKVMTASSAIWPPVPRDMTLSNR